MNTKLNITLNIGLDVSKHYTPEGVAAMELHYDYVADFLKKTLGMPACIGLAQSETEKTVVAQYSNVELVLHHLYWLARDLQQDCIAYQVQDGDTVIGGALVGKYAHEWNYGVFNKDYFIPAPFKN